MDTVPLRQGSDGPDRGDVPTERLAAVRTPVRPTTAVSRGLRALEIVAGLASGGLLLIGLTLLALQFLAPTVAPGIGLAAPSGPGWPRVAGQLGVGVAGELTVVVRRWAPRPMRWLLAAAVVVAAGAVLWLAWWR